MSEVFIVPVIAKHFIQNCLKLYVKLSDKQVKYLNQTLYTSQCLPIEGNDAKLPHRSKIAVFYITVIYIHKLRNHRTRLSKTPITPHN